MASARLGRRREAGADLALVTLAVDREHAAGYVRPGQYVEVQTASGPGFFALAGDVGAPIWELLVRRSGGASDALMTLPEGSAIDVSLALGDGFPMARAEGHPLVVAVTGSAVSVARPILRLRVESGEKQTSVFIGARAARDVPLTDEIASWVSAGVRVVLCLSRSELEHDRSLLPGVERTSGYVQHVLARAAKDHALIFAAGHEQMLSDIRALEKEGAVVITNI